MSESLECTLAARVRELLAAESTVEAELGALVEETNSRATTLIDQIEACEGRLDKLAANPGSSLGEIAAELNRVEVLRAQLAQTRSLLSELDDRARALRTEWLIRAADSPGPRQS